MNPIIEGMASRPPLIQEAVAYTEWLSRKFHKEGLGHLCPALWAATFLEYLTENTADSKIKAALLAIKDA